MYILILLKKKKKEKSSNKYEIQYDMSMQWQCKYFEVNCLRRFII